MKILGDYHTHTVYSGDGNGTLEENVRSAVFKGLKQIAVTEHGFTHLANGMKRADLEDYVNEIKRLRKNYKNIEILHGIEANITGIDGSFDLTEEETKMFDIIVLGYHRSYKPTSIKNFFNFFVPNTLGIGRKSPKQIERNTQAYINAIKTNKIDIVAHLNWGGCLVNCVEIAKVAKEYNTYIELNGKRIDFTDQEILDMQKTGVKFIINSDAHSPEYVGKNNIAINIIERLGIPHEQVANLDKIPVFKNYKKK